MMTALLCTACERQDRGGDASATPFAARQGGGAPMDQFSLPSAVDNTKVDSRVFQDQVLLVTFFATWCPPCLEEIPALIDLQDKYSGSGFSVVGLSMDEEGPGVVKSLIDKTGINYPVLMADRQVARNFGGISGIPTTFLVNRSGMIIMRYIGYTDYDALALDIQEALTAGKG